MVTEIQVDDGNGNWRDIEHGEWEIENGVSDVLVAPKANVRTHIDENIEPYQPIRIRIDGVTRFEGRTVSSGRRELGGGRRVQAKHEAYDLFDEDVSIEVTNADTEDVLQATLADSDLGSGFSLSYAGVPLSLSDDYVVENRKIKRVFRDIMDRTSRVWWINGDNVIHVQPYAHRGEWESISFPGDDGGVVQYDEGEVSTVRNDVTVNGTRGERVVGSASDGSSISDYGRHAETVNIEYITSQDEADAMADELLIPDPLAEGEVQLGSTVGDSPEQNLANVALTITDESKRIENETVVVEKQTIEQGRLTLKVGEGSGVSVENVNLSSKSQDDNSEPGSVMNTDRIADDAIASEKLVDTSVIEDKLADLSISETKVQDDAISTPKLEAEAVTANEILAGTITALEIAAGAITANEIDVLNLTAGDLSVVDDISNPSSGVEFDFDGTSDLVSIIPYNDEGARLGEIDGDWFLGIHGLTHTGSTYLVDSSVRPSADGVGTADLGSSGLPFDEVWAHSYNNASPKQIVSGIDRDELRKSSWYDPPEYVRERGRREIERAREKCEERGEDVREVVGEDPDPPVELGSMCNYLFEVCRDQQEQIESLEERLSELE